MPRSPSKPNSERRFHEGAGRRGEFWAELFLRAQLYRVLARRVKTHQEADALLAVNRRRIVNAAQLWLMRRPELAAGDQRFDVIFLAPFAWPRHIVNAFQ